jgi:type IV pilus assembly protein PilB
MTDITQDENENQNQEVDNIEVESTNQTDHQEKKTEERKDDVEDLKEVLEVEAKPNEVKEVELKDTSGFQEEDVVGLINEVLEEALKRKTSDIHIEPLEDRINIRFRIDGQFYHYKSYSIDILGYLKRRIKVLGGLKLDENRIPQDGKTSATFGDENVEFRISSFPTIYGEKIVIRILSDTKEDLDLKKLGFESDQLKKIYRAIEKSQGLVLCTGPTGSGKTTTLFSMLRKYDTQRFNIATLEDPVEYRLDGVNQTQMNPSIGFTFASGLRSLVRQDVDVIMVGEIRDKLTVDLAIDASLTGHAVYSTLHANSAVSTITRLLKLGMEPFLLASALNIIIAQRLVKRLCPDCKVEHEISKSTIDTIEESVGDETEYYIEDETFYKPKGCDKCNGTGYRGRIVISEILEITPEIEEMILESKHESEIEAKAKEQGMLNLHQDALLKSIKGLISVKEALKV